MDVSMSGQIWKFPLPSKGTKAVTVSNGLSRGGNDGARCVDPSMRESNVLQLLYHALVSWSRARLVFKSVH